MTRPQANQRLGDFVFVREIGRGGMGVVYEARQVSLNRRVALKVLSGGLGLTDQAVQRFRREAEAAAKLHHTNIVPVYVTGEEGGTHFYAMELIEGPSLDYVIHGLSRSLSPPAGHGGREAGPDQLSRTGPYVEGAAPPPSSGLSSSSLDSGGAFFDAVARMVAEVADALDHAHRNGVIHRDIKPSNLLLSPAGRLSLNDFGLARVLEQPGVTVTGEFVGTPAYMSPEQVTAGRVPVDHRTDIYSLGATLYELLTLRRPFTANRRDQVLAQILQKEPTRPRALNSKVPIDLETICLKAMDKDPDGRYQTAGQMADDLRRYVHRFAILAHRAGPVKRLQKWVKRNPALSAALLGAVACLGVAGGLAYRAHQAERRRAEQQARHNEEMLDERRHAALDRAILASRLEDFDGARQAIREAEKLGCSAGQVRMLQGQLELYQGRMKEAIEHLGQAVELMPDSVAAWSMLAVAYNDTGRVADSLRALGEAGRREAVTPEDNLFRGHAESMLNPGQSLARLDEAVRQRPSALARLVRLEPLRMSLLDTPDLEKAKLAMEDVQSIKRQLPRNVMTLSTSVSVYTVCYHVFGEFRQPDLQKAALDEGTKDAQALERFADSTRAVTAWWIFLKEVGRDNAAALASLRRAAEASGYLYAVAFCAQAMYIRGEFEQAIRMLERKRGETIADLLRVMALAEVRTDGFPRANELFREVAARDLSNWDLFNSQLVLRLLGRKPEAVEVSRKFLAQPDRFPPVRQESFRLALEYCAGRRSADDLIASLSGKRGDLCNAHFCIALTALADGNRPKARQHLRLCIDTRYFEYLPYDVSRILLSRLDKDEGWPAWIGPRP